MKGKKTQWPTTQSRGGSDKSSDNATDTEEESWKNGYRDLPLITLGVRSEERRVGLTYEAREFNLIEKKASQEKAKYLKYKSLNKASKKKSPVILELSEIDSSSSEEENSSDEEEEHSMTYDSELGGNDKSSNNATDTEEESWKSGCRDLNIIDKLNNSKFNIKEHKLSSNNLDTALNDAHL